MNAREELVKKRYEAEGWTVLRRGWPDFLAYRPAADGQLEVKPIEVKSGPNDLPSNDQQKMHELFSRLGLPVEVEVAPPKVLLELKRCADEYGKEKYFSIDEIAELWNLSHGTVRALFRDRAGVLKIGHGERLKKRGYVTLRIPASVVQQVHAELRGKAR